MDNINLSPEDHALVASLKQYVQQQHQYSSIRVAIIQHNLVQDLQKGRVAVAYRHHEHRFPQGFRDEAVIKSFIDGVAFGVSLGQREGTRDAKLSMLDSLGVSVDDDGTVRFNA